MRSAVGGSVIRARAVSLQISLLARTHRQTDSGFSPLTSAYIGQHSQALPLKRFEIRILAGHAAFLTSEKFLSVPLPLLEYAWHSHSDITIYDKRSRPRWPLGGTPGDTLCPKQKRPDEIAKGPALEEETNGWRAHDHIPPSCNG